MSKNIELYNKYFVATNRELLDLFRLLEAKYEIRSAIYPGSFIHMSPAFIYSEVVFIDNDRRIKKFFEDAEILKMVNNKREYKEEPNILAFQQNYEKSVSIPENHYDLLISQYGGFVSKYCKKYLKIGGILLVNNSHADAGLAHLDNDFKLIGVANHTKNKWRISEDKLEEYFNPKKGSHPSESALLETMKGVGYSKVASNYIFRRAS